MKQICAWVNPEIASALIWAGVMLLCGAILSGDDHGGAVLNVLVLGYVMHMGLVRGSDKQKCVRTEP